MKKNPKPTFTSVLDLMLVINETWPPDQIEAYLEFDIAFNKFAKHISDACTHRATVIDNINSREAEQKAALAKIEELMKTAQEIATKAGVPFVPPTTEEEFQSSDSWSSSNC